MQSNTGELERLSRSDIYLRDTFGVSGGICPFCGGEAEMDLFEIWEARHFQVSTCCEGMDEAVNEVLAEGGKVSADLLRAIDIDELGFGEIRRAADDEMGHLILDFHTRLVPVTLRQVQSFVERHHRHCKPPRGWRFGQGVVNGSVAAHNGGLLGVISCGRPVARALDQDRIIEANRVCIDHSLPSALAWNAASQLYGWAARESKRRGHEWCITYTLASEAGTSLRAAGFEPDRVTGGRDWNTKARPRTDSGPTDVKVRWRKQLVKRPVSVLNGDKASAEAFLREMESARERRLEQFALC